MSDGLIGVASTRMTISSAAGSGVGTETSETSSTPDFLTRDLSCRPVSMFGDAMFYSCAFYSSWGRRILTYPVRAGQQRRSQRHTRNFTATKPSTPAPEVVLAATTVAVVRQIGHMDGSGWGSHDNDDRRRNISTSVDLSEPVALDRPC